MEKYAIIVAGGEGTRLGGGLPKQFRPLHGKPVLWWSLKAFHDEDPSTHIRVVLHRDYFDEWRNLMDSLQEDEQFPHEVVAGGKSRTESVKNGIDAVPSSSDALIAVHDAARPLVSVDMIRRGWAAAEAFGGAVPAVAVTDSLRKRASESVSGVLNLLPSVSPVIEEEAGKCETGSVAVDRSDYVAVQTPQVFRADLLKGAYERNPEAVYSDDASAFEAAGGKPVIFDGTPLNMKITNPGDIEIAGILMEWL